MGIIGDILSFIIILIIVGFLTDTSETKRFLREKPIEQFLAPMLEEINKQFYSGMGTVEKVKYNRIYLIYRKDTVMFEFRITAMVLNVFVHYKWFHQDKYEPVPATQVEFLASDKAQKEYAQLILQKAWELKERQYLATLSYLQSNL